MVISDTWPYLVWLSLNYWLFKLYTSGRLLAWFQWKCDVEMNVGLEVHAVQVKCTAQNIQPDTPGLHTHSNNLTTHQYTFSYRQRPNKTDCSCACSWHTEGNGAAVVVHAHTIAHKSSQIKWYCRKFLDGICCVPGRQGALHVVRKWGCTVGWFAWIKLWTLGRKWNTDGSKSTGCMHVPCTYAHACGLVLFVVTVGTWQQAKANAVIIPHPLLSREEIYDRYVSDLVIGMWSHG